MRLTDDVLGFKPASWPKFFIGLIGVPILYFLLANIIIIFFFVLREQGLIGFDIQDLLWGSDASSQPRAIAFTFGLIGAFHLVLWPFMRMAYHRAYFSLVNPLKMPARPQIKWALIYTLAMILVTEILAVFGVFAQGAVNMVWQPALWIAWILPISLIVLLQISAEEFFFRGFMQQYLARLVPNRWVYILIPSACWAVLHYGNYDSPTEAIPITASIFVMGVVFGDWADRSRSLFGPLVVHFMNNFLLICVYGSSLEPSAMNIWQFDASALTEGEIGVYGAVSALTIIAVYLPIRNRIVAREPRKWAQSFE